ncbi:putative protein FAM183A isoform 2 [Scophthalmus maximus]|nr:putative protein FAM183A isoform 2 [Scophthalmus maximus]
MSISVYSIKNTCRCCTHPSRAKLGAWRHRAVECRHRGSGRTLFSRRLATRKIKGAEIEGRGGAVGTNERRAPGTEPSASDEPRRHRPFVDMAEKKEVDVVHQNAIHVETIRKEQRHQKLHTEFSINPRRKLHVLTDKPMSKKPAENIVENPEFLEAFHKAHQEPTKKYPMPVTESQEIGWVSTPLIPENRSDGRIHFNHRSTDVTRHKESALKAGK